MSGFALDLNKFAVKTADRMDLAKRKIVLEVYRRLVQRTPVDTGRAQNNWNVSDDSPDLSTTDEAAQEQAVINEVMAQVEEYSAGGVIWISNNLPYIIPLEEGHSDQAPPGGIVQITLEEFEQIIRQAGASAKSKRP